MIPLRDDNPSELRPIVTVSLIVIVTLVFLGQVSLAFRAHVGGFIAGLALVGLFKRPGFRLAIPLLRGWMASKCAAACGRGDRLARA